MATSSDSRWIADIPVPPGETIREILDERGLSQADFALRLGRTEKNVSQVVNGKAPVTHELAIDLERVLGVPAAFWNAAESNYRDLLARQAERERLAADREWVRSFPLKEMSDRDWIARETSPEDQAEAMLAYFGVSSVDAWRKYWGSKKRLAARISATYSPDVASLTAWLRRGEIEAEQIQTAPFDATRFRSVLVELRPASRLEPDEWQAKVRELCASAGVAVAFVPDLPRTRAHGVSWWANPGRALIEVGLRFGTDDQVWFSLYHEAGHVLLHDRRSTRIHDLDGNPELEEEANAFAAAMLIPRDAYASFLSNGKPTKATVRAFAEMIGIAPGIVVGRLQKDSVIPHSWLNDLKVKLAWV